MADNIPLFPDESNVARFRDFVNIQKEMNDHLLTERRLYEQIGRVSLDVEAKVVERRKNEFRMMKLIRDKALEYNELVQRRAIVTGQERDDLERNLLSIETQIRYNKELLSMSKEASAIEMEMAKKIHEENTRWFSFAGQQMNKLFGLNVKEYNLSKDIGEELIKQGVQSEKIAYAWGAVLMMLKGAFDLFKRMDKAAWSFRKAMGMTRAESAVIRKDAQRIAIDYMHIGVSVESVYKSYQALGKAVGGVHNVSKSLVEDVSVMAAQLGISEETSAKFLRNMAAVSKSTMESQTAMMYIAKDMSNAAGVQLDEVMSDIATKSSKTLTMMSRMPNIALRTAIELRRMGTDMNAAANSSRHILDFTENVNEEMEASVLLGRSINLQRARELAYRRDLEGSTKEILRITKSVNFENLDVFQQEAFARATGKSVEELLKMLQTSRQLERVKRAGTPEQKAQLALYEKMRKENEAAAKARAKDVSAELRRMGNQERLVQIQNKWNALLAKAQEFLLPVIDKLLGGALALVDWAPAIMAFMKPLGNIFGWLAKIVGVGSKIEAGFSKFGWWVSKSVPWLEKIMKAVAGVGTKLGAWVGWFSKGFGFLSKYLGFLGKFLGPIGWVIMAFQAISGFISGWNKTTGNWIQKLGGGVMGALRGLIPGFDYIVKAVQWVWKYVGPIATFIFKWLSPIGWAIQGFKLIQKHLGDIWGAIKYVGSFLVKGAKLYYQAWAWAIGKIWSGVKSLYTSFVDGIKAIGGMVLDALISPYKKAWNWVKSLWGGSSPSQVGLSILKGIASVGSMIFDALTAPFRKGIAWIADKIPGMSKFADKLRGGTKGMMQPVEKKATAAYIPAVTVTPKGTEVASVAKKPGEAGKAAEKESPLMSEETGCKIVALLEKILAKDMSVHMDGQLLSTHLARQTEFRGGYGVNKVA